MYFRPPILGSGCCASLFNVAAPDFERGEVQLLALPNGAVGKLRDILLIFRCYAPIAPNHAGNRGVCLPFRLTITPYTLVGDLAQLCHYLQDRHFGILRNLR